MLRSLRQLERRLLGVYSFYLYRSFLHGFGPSILSSSMGLGLASSIQSFVSGDFARFDKYISHILNCGLFKSLFWNSSSVSSLNNLFTPFPLGDSRPMG